MGVVKPGRALVVQVGERALLQLGLGGVRGVEPVVAQLHQAPGGIRDCFHDGGIVLGWLLSRWPGHWEGAECLGGVVAGIVSYSHAVS